MRELPTDVDEECKALCEIMNLFPGIATTSSCCGHGKSPYTISFAAESLDYLLPVLYWFDSCHSGRAGWSVTVSTDCTMAGPTFTVVGPKGDSAYVGARHIAKLLKDHLIKTKPRWRPKLPVGGLDATIAFLRELESILRGQRENLTEQIAKLREVIARMEANENTQQAEEDAT